MSNMKEKLFELKLQLGYKFDEEDIECKRVRMHDESIEPKHIEIKDKKMVELFENIIDYLQEELLSENGFYY